MKYYLHDTNAFQDEKITELFIRFGYEGIGLFYTILEKLAAQEKPVKTIVLKRQLSVGKKLEKVWQFLEEIELIYSNNGETFNKRLGNFLETFDKKRENTKNRVTQHRQKQGDTENVTRYTRVSNAPNSIVLNSIVNKIDVVVDDAREASEVLPSEEEDQLTLFAEKLSATDEFVDHAARMFGKPPDWVRGQIVRFFNEQRALGNNRCRVWSEARQHCYNWIRIQAEKQPIERPHPAQSAANGTGQGANLKGKTYSTHGFKRPTGT